MIQAYAAQKAKGRLKRIEYDPGGQHSLSGSPTGAPATLRTMLDFCARHRIEPVTESFPMSRINEALAHLRDGKTRYRVVLENDLG